MNDDRDPNEGRIGNAGVSRTVPGLALASVQAPVRESPKRVGEWVREALAKGDGFVPATLQKQRLYAGYLEPLDSGKWNEAIISPPGNEPHALDDWRYACVDWAVLCFRPMHMSVYAAVHADISFGLGDGRIPWRRACLVPHPIAFLTLGKDDGAVIGMYIPGGNEKSRHHLDVRIGINAGEVEIVPNR